MESAVVPFDGEAHFTVIVSNTGNLAAANFSVFDEISSSGLILTDFPVGSTITGSTIETPVASLAPGAQMTLDYRYKRFYEPCAPEQTFTNCAWSKLCKYEGNTSCASVTFQTEPVDADPSFTFSISNCNNFQFSSVPLEPGQTEFWDFGDGASTSMPDPSHTFANGTFTVTHTVTECGTDFSSMQVVMVDCVNLGAFSCPCSTPGSLNIDAGSGTPVTAIPELNNLPGGVLDLDAHGNCLAIRGLLIIDKDLHILDPDDGTDSYVYMQPGSEIDVNAVRNLSVVGCNIAGCDAMWKGIVVNAFGHLDLLNNRLSDAQYGVYVASVPHHVPPGPLPATWINIQRNVFVNNYVGVRTSPSAGYIQHIPFTANTFKSEPPLLPAFDNLSFYSNQSGYIGVMLQNSQFSVGPVNTFELLRNGVVAQSCKVNVCQNNFNNIIGQPTSSPNFLNGTEGIGILALNMELTAEGNTFDKLHTGIFTENNKITVTNNDFEGVVRGLYSNRAFNLEIRDNNPVRFREMGFEINHIAPLIINSSFEISGNTLESTNSVLQNSDRWAIEINNEDNMHPKKAIIRDNTININDNVGGVQLSNTNGWQLQNNRVAFEKNPSGNTINTTAFCLDNSSKNILNVNGASVESGPDGIETIGFQTGIGQENIYCCNASDYMETGFEFSGMCPFTDFRFNTITNTQYSLHCTDGTQLGEQKDKGNLFEPGSGTAWHEGGDFDVQNSQFIVFDENMNGIVDDMPYSPEQMLQTNSTVPWFKRDVTYDGDCNSDPVCQDLQLPEQPGRVIDVSDIEFVSSIEGSGARNQVRYWERGLNLYGRLKDYPELTGLNSDVDIFYSNESYGDVGQFWSFEHNLRQAYNLQEDLAAQLEDAWSALDSMEALTTGILQELDEAQNELDYAQICLDADSQRAAMEPAIDQVLKIQSYEKQQVQGLATALLEQITTLPESNTVQYNRKYALQTYTRLLAEQRNELTQEEFELISKIANQCPLEGGGGVYIARSLYQLNERAWFDDASNCRVEERGSAGPSAMAEPLFMAVPNPASDGLKIIGLDTDSGGIQRIQIFSVQGRIVFEKNDNEARPYLEINTSSWPSGLYFAQITTAEGGRTQIKFIIQK